jgi:hypothetical protein
MDLLDKAEEIVMIILLILQNPMALAFCVLPLATNPKQKGSNIKEKLQEVDTSILTRRKKIGGTTTRIPNFFY